MPAAILISGLPHDVRDAELMELLVSEPLRLVPSSVSVTALYGSTGAFLGTFMVEVGSESDAERVRQQFSGQVVDNMYTLAVHHVLKPTMSHPNLPVAGAGRLGQQTQPRPQSQASGAPSRPKFTPKNDKSPGEELLARMNKSGKAGDNKNKQKLLLEKQREAVKSAQKKPGDALLSRLNKLPKGKTAAAARANGRGGAGAGSAAAAGSGGATKAAAAGSRAKKSPANDKVARAKTKQQRMDVDQTPKAPKPKPEVKAKPKTQAELDEEMKAYERARRFAAA